MCAEDTIAAPPGRRPQFGLKALFCFMTWVAVMTALAISRLAVWMPFAIGFTVACLNCAGHLAPCQRRPRQTQLFCAAWSLFVASMFMPAVQVFGPMSGWEAANICLDYLLRARSDEQNIFWRFYVLNGMFTMANLLLTLSPLFLWRLRYGRGQWYGGLFVVAAAAMWCALTIKVGPLIGYVVWCLEMAPVLRTVEVLKSPGLVKVLSSLGSTGASSLLFLIGVTSD